jgi:hypothetical protein
MALHDFRTLYGFPQISRIVVHEIITAQVLRKMGFRNAHGCTQNTENGLGFDIFGAIHKDGDEQ